MQHQHAGSLVSTGWAVTQQALLYEGLQCRDLLRTQGGRQARRIRRDAGIHGDDFIRQGAARVGRQQRTPDALGLGRIVRQAQGGAVGLRGHRGVGQQSLALRRGQALQPAAGSRRVLLADQGRQDLGGQTRLQQGRRLVEARLQLRHRGGAAGNAGQLGVEGLRGLLASDAPHFLALAVQHQITGQELDLPAVPGRRAGRGVHVQLHELHAGGVLIQRRQRQHILVHEIAAVAPGRIEIDEDQALALLRIPQGGIQVLTPVHGLGAAHWQHQQQEALNQSIAHGGVGVSRAPAV